MHDACIDSTPGEILAGVSGVFGTTLGSYLCGEHGRMNQAVAGRHIAAGVRKTMIPRLTAFLGFCLLSMSDALGNVVVGNVIVGNVVVGNALGQNDAATESHPVLITNDAVVFGILISILALVFWTHSLPNRFWVRFYKVFPLLLLCYFLPSLLTLFRIVDPEASSLPFVAKRYLLPASLVLLTVSIDLREVLKLGPKALAMFITGTVGVILGGPLAILMVGMFNPTLVGGADAEAVWRGLSTVAGSWIGGSANQVAMKEVFAPSNELFSVMLAVDIVVAEVWMAFLLLGIGKADWIDEKFGADSSSVRPCRKRWKIFPEASRGSPPRPTSSQSSAWVLASRRCVTWSPTTLPPGSKRTRRRSTSSASIRPSSG